MPQIFLPNQGFVISKRADQIKIGDICIWNSGIPTKIIEIHEKKSGLLGMVSISLVQNNRPIKKCDQITHTSTLRKNRMVGIAPDYIISWLKIYGAL